MQISTLALLPGLCSEEGCKAGVTVCLSVVTDTTEDGAVMKSHRLLATSVGNKDFKAG